MEQQLSDRWKLHLFAHAKHPKHSLSYDRKTTTLMKTRKLFTKSLLNFSRIINTAWLWPFINLPIVVQFAVQGITTQNQIWKRNLALLQLLRSSSTISGTSSSNTVDGCRIASVVKDHCNNCTFRCPIPHQKNLFPHLVPTLDPNCCLLMSSTKRPPLEYWILQILDSSSVFSLM